jgi:hypothetical protein
MRLVDRVKNIVMTPKTEWTVIEAEATPIGQVITGYVLPLAAIAAVATFISVSIIGTNVPFVGNFRMGIGWGLGQALYSLVMAVVFVFVLGFIIDALAPTFSGQRNMLQAQKLAAYSYTPAWIATVFTIVPWIGSIIALVGAIYGLYLLYLGLPRLMKNPPDKSAGYTALVVVSAIVVAVIISIIGGLITAPAMMGAGPTGSMRMDPGSPAGKLDEFARKMEEANRKMEAAEKSGDPKKQMEAAMGALGTALSGGKGVEPVQIDVLKPFAPDRFAGLERTDMRADRSGVAGLMATKVEADYGSGDRRVQLEIVDTGGAAGLMGLAGWASLGATTESESSERVERMRREGNRVVREEISKRGGTNTYAVILADRFMVSAEGSGVDIGTLKGAVGNLDLGKLEALK